MLQGMKCGQRRANWSASAYYILFLKIVYKSDRISLEAGFGFGHDGEFSKFHFFLLFSLPLWKGVTFVLLWE